MIHATQVTRQVGGRELFTDVSFFLPAGSYTYLAGESGSGKTVLLEMIAGIQRPDSGSLVVNDIDMIGMTADRLPYIRRQLGFVESTALLLQNRNVAENVRMPLDIAGFDRRASDERVSQKLDELGLTPIANIAVQRLSDDQRWLVACARATVHRPGLLLIDEPATGISDAATQRQRELVHQLHLEGTTVLSTGAEYSCDQRTLRLELQQGRSFVDEYNAISH